MCFCLFGLAWVKGIALLAVIICVISVVINLITFTFTCYTDTKSLLSRLLILIKKYFWR